MFAPGYFRTTPPCHALISYSSSQTEIKYISGTLILMCNVYWATTLEQARFLHYLSQQSGRKPLWLIPFHRWEKRSIFWSEITKLVMQWPLLSVGHEIRTSVALHNFFYFCLVWFLQLYRQGIILTQQIRKLTSERWIYCMNFHD